MKPFANLFRFVRSAILLVLFFCTYSESAFAAYTAIYASDGNDGYTFTGCFTVQNLKASCWNGIIMFAASVQPNGDITAGGATLVSGGVYKGDPNWGSNVTNLKTPPTSVTRYELCVGGWGDGSWGNMQAIVNSQGAYGTLRTNFLALKNACPGLDAINDDDEGNYDINSSTSIGQMLNSIGMKLTQAPYMNQGFWVQLKNNLGTGCDIVYLQCYQGGAGNDPGQWDSAYGNGFHVVPGEETNYASQAQFTTWASADGITGGFFWPDWYWCPGTNWPTQIAAGIGTNCSLPAVTPYLQVNGAAWQQTNNATVPFGALVNLGPQDSGEAWSWNGPGGFSSNSREIDSIPLSVGTNTFTVTNTTQCVCNQTTTFTITMQPPASCASASVTFGNTATGTGCCNLDGQLDCCSYNLSQAMTVNSLQIYMGSGTNCHGVLGIYSDNGGSPGTLLAQSNATLMTSGWNTFAVPNTALVPGNYWLSASFDTGTANFFYSNAGGGGLLWKAFSYNGSMPSAPGSGFTGYGWLMSMYASGCAVAPTPTPTWTVPPCTTSSTTFGNTSSANAGSAGAGGIIGGTAYTLSQPMTVTSLSFYFSAGTTGSGVVGLYSDLGGKPNSLLVQSNAQALNAGTWNNFVVKPTVLPAGNYWIYGSFTGTVNWQYSNGCCTGGYLWGGYTYNGSLPATMASGLTGYGWTMCAYASGCLQPTPTPTQTSTPTKTYTSTSTFTFTPTNTFTTTNTSTFVPTKTSTPTSTSTFTYTPTRSFTPTNTQTSTNSFTYTPTKSFTPTNTSTSTNTLTITPTNTATATATNTFANTSTNTPTKTFTPANTSTNTFTSTATSINTLTPTNTPTQSSTLTTTTTNTYTNTSTPTNSATKTSTSTNTRTITPTSTAIATDTFTFTTTAVPPTNTFTATKTNTPTRTFTNTPTNTPTNTFTSTPTKINTFTSTPTFTATSTPTLPSGCSGIPAWNGNFVLYAIGARVTYNGELYQCIQAHTSEPNWMPPVVPALWKDMGSCTSVSTAVLFPNPVSTSGQVNLKVPLTQTSDVSVQIYTLNFRKIKDKTFPQVAIGSDLALELTDQWYQKLANGLYYVQVKAGAKSWIIKLLVVR